MQRMRMAIHQLIQNRHDVSVGMFDDIIAHLAISRDQPFQIRRHEFRELFGRKERIRVEAVVRAQRKRVQRPPTFDALRLFQMPFQ